MHMNWNRLRTIIVAATVGVGLFLYTRYSRREMHRLRQGSRLVMTSKGPVEIAERGSGDPVLVVQGSTGGYNLGLYLAWPETDFHYIIPSRPGFLRTPLKNAVTPEQQADLLANLLDSMQIQRVPVIALSGCGPQVFQFALRYPDRISSLVLLSVASRPIPLFVLILRVIRTLLRYAPLLPALLLNRVPENRFLSSRQKAAIQNNPGRIDELRRLLTVVFPIMPRLPGMLNDLYWMVNQPQYPIDNITAPTMVLHGDEDIILPLEQAQYTTRHIPKAKCTVIPGAGHFAFAVLNDEIKKMILHFIHQHR
jgi:2-hydroxy-6-oxonona-2,4-dienedioate hydrolase